MGILTDNAYSPIVGQVALGTLQSCYHILMIGKGVGVLALAALLGFISYYETSFLRLQQLSAAAPAAVAGTLALVPVAPLQTAPAATPPDYSGYNKAKADEMCPRADAFQCYFTGNT